MSEEVNHGLEKYIWQGTPQDGLSPVISHGKYGFLNEEGVEIIPCVYDAIRSDFFGELVGVLLNDKWGFIDKKGNIIVPFKYAWVGEFEKGLVAVREANKYGMIDRQGKIVVPLIFDWVTINPQLYKGLAIVVLKDVKLFMDFEGNYYEFNSEKKRIKCEECHCYNDKIITGLCCQFTVL